MKKEKQKVKQHNKIFEIIAVQIKRAETIVFSATKGKGINLMKWKSVATQAINEIVSQSWTVFGLLIGWVVLPDGETRNFVGSTLGILTVVWLITMPLRISSEE